MKPPKQPKPPIAGAKHEWAANVRAGVRSASTSKKPRHENDVQEAGQNQAGGEEGRGRPAAKPEPSEAEREAISRATVRLSERPRRVALRTETIKGKLAEIGPPPSDPVGWLAPGRCRMHGGASPGAPRGEANGNYRHGHYGREAIQERRALRALIRQARKLAASVG